MKFCSALIFYSIPSFPIFAQKKKKEVNYTLVSQNQTKE